MYNLHKSQGSTSQPVGPKILTRRFYFFSPIDVRGSLEKVNLIYDLRTNPWGYQNYTDIFFYDYFFCKKCNPNRLPERFEYRYYRNRLSWYDSLVGDFNPYPVFFGTITESDLWKKIQNHLWWRHSWDLGNENYMCRYSVSWAILWY